jgi:photosynthetic reaction center cytochrome c subunit
MSRAPEACRETRSATLDPIDLGAIEQEARLPGVGRARRVVGAGTVPLVAIAAGLLIAACGEHPPVHSKQIGYRGVGMVQTTNPRTDAQKAARNEIPEPLPPVEAVGPKVSEVYQNIQVLGDLTVPEFTRLMAAMTSWVAPEQGCAYCHSGANLASDDLYTKVVARRMLQMTSHVKGTGVTCYTCHRGLNVPANLWFTMPKEGSVLGQASYSRDRGFPAPAAGLSSLPYDPYSGYLDKPGNIRVISQQALPEVGSRGRSIQSAEMTYSVMLSISQALGVNCTYCHNSRSFTAWDQSTPARAQAWYGIQMVRNLNIDYLGPLTAKLPHNRLGPLGDGPKVNCATCHQGVSKPLLGVSMYKDYLVLGPPHTEATAPEGSTPPEGAPAPETAPVAPAAAGPAKTAAPAAPAPMPSTAAVTNPAGSAMRGKTS